MRNRYLGRTSASRRALFSNLLGALLIHESIETTLAKAKDLRIIAEKIISIAKRDQIERSSLVRKYLHDNEAKKKLAKELSQRYQQRPGGYTRIFKTHFRTGDAAPMAVIMLVDHIENAAKPLLDSSITSVKTTKAKVAKHEQQGDGKPRPKAKTKDNNPA